MRSRITPEQAAGLIGTDWEGGARYLRGRVMYRPVWRIRQVRYEEVRHSSANWWREPHWAWFVYMERMDDHSASEPPGKIRRIALQCFEGFGWPTYRRVEKVHAS